MSATTYTFTPENSYILNRLGANNGIAELDSSGKVPASQLPSYVDDVVEAHTYNDFPITGESGKIYVDLSTNKTYRWGGSSYVEISESLALGETESTAYRGDRGKEAYDHAMAKGRGFSSGFYKVATNTEGHVTNVVPVAKSDIVNLGIPGDDFVGATTDATGVHGYVPAPAVEDRNKFLSGNGTWKEAPGAKLIEVVLTPVSNESGAYTGTTRDFRITAGMKCIILELGNPAAFKSNITVTAGDGNVTLSCASVEGESSATASFLKTAEDPTAITTSEFDYLENAKVDKAPTAVEGHFVSFNTVGNLIDSGYSANNVLIVPSDVTEGKVPQTNSNGEIVWTDLKPVTVENSLTSTSTTNALSAAQGKVLNDNKVNISDIVDVLNDTSTNKPLSAAKGKALNDSISSLNTKIGNVGNTDLQTQVTSLGTNLQTQITNTNTALTNTNNKIGTVPSGQTVEGQISSLSTKIGSVGTTDLQTQVSALGSKLDNLSTEKNTTKDILADALNVTDTKFFKGSGFNYTGSVPEDNYKYGVFCVSKRDTSFFVAAMSSNRRVAINFSSNGSSWSGWKELADKTSVDTLKTIIQTTIRNISHLPQSVSYGGTTGSGITASHVVIGYSLSNPAAMRSDWTIETAANAISISGSIDGSTNLTLYLADPKNV